MEFLKQDILFIVSSSHIQNGIVKRSCKASNNPHLFKVVRADALKKQKHARNFCSNIKSILLYCLAYLYLFQTFNKKTHYLSDALAQEVPIKSFEEFLKNLKEPRGRLRLTWRKKFYTTMLLLKYKTKNVLFLKKFHWLLFLMR